MVRRWSYINNINNSLLLINYAKIKPTLNALRISTFKATTYYWENLYFDNVTLLTRKSYYRRKHINTLVFYQNIITSWSKDYLFFRKYSRSIFNLNLSKYNYLSQNLILSKSQDITNLVGFESIKLTFIPNLIYSFISLGGINVLPFFVKYKGPYLYISSLKGLTKTLIKDTALRDSPLYPILGNNTFFNLRSYKNLNIVNLLIESLFKTFLSKGISYYSIFILTLLK
jgi:hypothetical protein